MQILAKVYLARSDVGFSVRAAAVHVWKTLVTNTPRTLSEILPCLMENIIELLASEGATWFTVDPSLDRDVRMYQTVEEHAFPARPGNHYLESIVS